MSDSSMAATLASKGCTTWALGLIVLLWLPGCRQKAEFHKTMIVNSDPATKVEIIVSPKVPHREVEGSFLVVSQDDAGTMRAMDFRLLIGEDALEYTEGTVKIGDRSFGKLDGPTLIEIKPHGVFVNGELRGPLDPEK